MPIFQQTIACCRLRSAELHFRVGRAGFSLLELLLAVSLLVLLGGVFAISVNAMQSGAELKHGAEQFQTALRMARAEAAAQGKRVQISFVDIDAEETDEDSGYAAVLLETDPIESPGQFEPWNVCAWVSYLSETEIRVTASTLTGDSALSVLDTAETAKGSEETLANITFYPDGSSDSAEVELAPRDSDDTHRVTVRLNGLTGELTATEHVAEADDE